ncbi:HEPN domain-containing protein [Hymenobacter coccineus]|uniref:HEPN domain-containing protein n=1 Tax=Hymenobacter coccineus TaxID=1908235 RepID=UPI0009F5DE05|nr:HEPN domain-containing protein [Hymenobacter coccineus]
MTPYGQFKANSQRVKDLNGLHNTLGSITTQALDLSDILRAEVVLIVSAFDYYIHDVVRYNIVETFQGRRSESKNFKLIQLRMESVKVALANPSSTGWLADEIYMQHSWKTFQHPDNVANALRLITDKKIWEEVATSLGQPVKSVKNRFELIVERRNKIAHEADADITLPTRKLPIDETMVKEIIDFIETVIEKLEAIL